MKLVIGKAYAYSETDQRDIDLLLNREKIFLDADLNVSLFRKEKEEQKQVYNKVRSARAAYLRNLSMHTKYSKHKLKSLIYRSGYPNHWIYKSH